MKKRISEHELLLWSSMMRKRQIMPNDKNEVAPIFEYSTTATKGFRRFTRRHIGRAIRNKNRRITKQASEIKKWKEAAFRAENGTHPKRHKLERLYKMI